MPGRLFHNLEARRQGQWPISFSSGTDYEARSCKRADREVIEENEVASH